MADESGTPTPLEMAILQAVTYSGLFGYPLTEEELLAGLPEVRVPGDFSPVALYRSSRFLQSRVGFQEGLFFPAGRRELIEFRRRRRHWSLLRLQRLRPVLRLLCSLPYVRSVALSGSAAHLNMDPDADVDLFILTRGPKVWSVAVTILVLTRLLGCRTEVCFNLILSDRRMEVASQDLFTANQIIHLKPLSGIGHLRRFIAANAWVSVWYPNFRLSQADTRPETASLEPAAKVQRALEVFLDLGLGTLLEACCRAAYRRYLLRQRSTWQTPEEVVLDRDFLKLHTRSHRQEVLERFRLALAQALSGDAALSRRSRQRSRGRRSADASE